MVFGVVFDVVFGVVFGEGWLGGLTVLGGDAIGGVTLSGAEGWALTAGGEVRGWGGGAEAGIAAARVATAGGGVATAGGGATLEGGSSGTRPLRFGLLKDGFGWRGNGVDDAEGTWGGIWGSLFRGSSATWTTGGGGGGGEGVGGSLDT